MESFRVDPGVRIESDAHVESEIHVDPGVHVPVPAPGETWAVGAVILDAQGRAFAQKRGPDRRLFPGRWDIVGGHVEPGEALLDALAREIEEETGWLLRRVRRFLGLVTWAGDDGCGVRHEADYLVEVAGDLAEPSLEWAKHSAYGWFGPDDLDALTEVTEATKGPAVPEGSGGAAGAGGAGGGAAGAGGAGGGAAGSAEEESGGSGDTMIRDLVARALAAAVEPPATSS
ncbi:NUDIX hydrolase [Streptomyces sp. NPDC002564]|uniref:NUDIX hydrolase n=1 Tax=Streptomyces sp. NPDC002564 TaxID=3364649 RepID=UPI00369BF4AA